MFWKKKESAPHDKSWLSKLSDGLSASSQKLTQGIVDAVTKRPLDQSALDELEEVLIMADLGPSLAARLVEDFGKNRFGKQVTESEVKQALAEQITEILKAVTPATEPGSSGDILARIPGQARDDGLRVILMVGVNGSGKTTTIGKLAAQFTSAGNKVVLAAGDTFRAAAVEQLRIWSERTGATFISKGQEADAAAVAFEAVEAAQREGADVLLIDTAGRLQNKTQLMDELAKIVRVIQKRLPDAPHATILTLDATTGQNALAQVEEFSRIAPLTGLVVTKLDGSARAGMVVALAEKFALPILGVGVGEGVADLQPFDAAEFSHRLLGI